MSRKFVAMLVIGAVLLVGAVAGVLYGVLTHREQPLLMVCWDDTGVALYTGGADLPPAPCAAPVPLRWPDGAAPLGVTIAGAQGEPVEAWHRRVTKAGVDAINAQVGCQALRLGDGATRVAVEFGHPAAAGDPVADCVHVGQGGRATAATVHLRNVGSEAEAASIVTHELGHALGLAHVDAQDAVMRPLQPDELLPGLPTLRLTDAQVRALRAEFCGR